MLLTNYILAAEILFRPDGSIKYIVKYKNKYTKEFYVCDVGNYHEGLAYFIINKDSKTTKTCSYNTHKQLGYMDKNNKVIIEPRDTWFEPNTESIYSYDANFKEGLAISYLKQKNGNYKGGFINKKGTFVIPAKFGTVCQFKEGLAVVANSSNTAYGFINKAGNYIIKPIFKYNDSLSNCASSFSEGLAPVKVGKKWGYINKHAKMVIKPQFDSMKELNYEYASSFNKGVAKVRIGNKYGYIDKNGKLKSKTLKEN